MTDEMEYCLYNDKKYAFDERIEIDCDSVCTCMASTRLVKCEPRCPPKNSTNEMREQCVTVPDPNDSCCTIEFCDVTLDEDHEQGVMTMPSSSSPNQTTKDTSKSGAITTTMTTIGVKADDDSDGPYDCDFNGKKYRKGER